MMRKESVVIKQDDGYIISVGGKSLSFSDGRAIIVKNFHLARAISREWSNVPDTQKVDREHIPFTHLVVIEQEISSRNRLIFIDRLIEYLNSDLLCYWSKHSSIVRDQEQQWQPLLEWYNEVQGLHIRITNNILPIKQSEKDIKACRKNLESYSNHLLAAIYIATIETGSLCLATALVHARVKPTEVVKLAMLDEENQMRIWGRDREIERRIKGLEDRMQSIFDYLILLNTSP